MRAGKLRHPATIEEPTTSRLASGDVTTTWSEFDETYVRIIPLTGRDLWNAQQMQADFSHQIEARYVPGVNSGMRLVVGSRVFHIAEPPENIEEMNVLLLLLCVEAEA